MFTLKLFLLFFITKATVSWRFSYPTDSSESSDITNEDYTSSGPKLSHLCPDKDHSLISNSDVKYLIEDIALKEQIEGNLRTNYDPDAETILERYSNELQELQEELEDRPEHMLHLLSDFAKMRQILEPIVADIENQLETFEARLENYFDTADRSSAMLKQLEKYKKICKINCEDWDIDTRFGSKPHTNLPGYTVNNEMSCITLKDLFEYITEKLNLFEEEFGRNLQSEIESRNEIYSQKLNNLRIDLKTAAVKKFGMTMYDMLSLQDDYYHFTNFLKNNNISAELDKIEENSAEIKLRLIGLKRDMEKYRQYCMNCNRNQRAKRDVENIHYLDSDMYSDEESSDQESDIVDQLIKVKTDEIKHSIQNHLYNMFEGLDAKFNDPDIINTFVSKLEPIQDEVEHEIKYEQDALEILQNRVQKLSVDEIINLSKGSELMIQKLEAAKQFVDHYNSEYSE